MLLVQDGEGIMWGDQLGKRHQLEQNNYEFCSPYLQTSHHIIEGNCLLTSISDVSHSSIFLKLIKFLFQDARKVINQCRISQSISGWFLVKGNIWCSHFPFYTSSAECHHISCWARSYISLLLKGAFLQLKKLTMHSASGRASNWKASCTKGKHPCKQNAFIWSNSCCCCF